MDSSDTEARLSRRGLLAAGTGAALGVSLLSACGQGSTSSPSPSAAPSGGAGSASGGSGPQALASLADIPVGGAVSATGADGKPVIVAQPSRGQVKAFSAICTHMGCTVAPQGKILKCPCHGSTYDLATGDNTGGPAPRPLAPVAVKVEAGEVVES